MIDWSYDKKNNYSIKTIREHLLISGFVPIIFVGIFIEYLFKIPEKNNLIHVAFIFLAFCLFYIISDYVYVKPRSSLYVPFGVIPFSLFSGYKIAQLLPEVFYLLRDKPADLNLELVLADYNWATIVVISSITLSYCLEKYLVGSPPPDPRFSLFRHRLKFLGILGFFITIPYLYYYFIMTNIQSVPIHIFENGDVFYMFIRIIWFSIFISFVGLLLYIIYETMCSKKISGRDLYG